MASMNFSSSKQYVRPPQRGIFPLDHDGECKLFMEVSGLCVALKLIPCDFSTGQLDSLVTVVMLFYLFHVITILLLPMTIFVTLDSFASSVMLLYFLNFSYSCFFPSFLFPVRIILFLPLTIIYT